MAKKKSKNLRDNKNKGKKVVYLLFVFGVFLVVLLIGLVAKNIGVLEHSPEEKKIAIEDKCALVMGNLIHQVRDDGECRIKCINECGIREMNFDYVEFETKDNDCNNCDCWCN